MITSTRFLQQPSGHEFFRGPGVVWTLVYLETGSMTYDMQNDPELRVVAGPNQLVLVRPETYFREHTQMPVAEIYAHFQPDNRILPFLNWPELLPGIMCLDLPTGTADADAIKTSLWDMVRLKERSLPETEIMASNALDQVLLLGSLASPARSPGPLDSRISEALSLIADHYCSPLSVPHLATRVGMSASRFAYCFRAQVGTTPAAFIEHRRLERARDLLLQTSLSVKEIAHSTGFINQGHFSTRFHKLIGQAPLSFRRRLEIT